MRRAQNVPKQEEEKSKLVTGSSFNEAGLSMHAKTHQVEENMSPMLRAEEEYTEMESRSPDQKHLSQISTPRTQLPANSITEENGLKQR